MTKLTKKQTGNKLENYVAGKLIPIDKYARKTRASGGSTELGDVQNRHFYVECKARSTKNITIKNDVWDKLCAEMPVGSNKIPIYALENVYNHKWIVLDMDTFFQLMYKIYPKDE